MDEGLRASMVFVQNMTAMQHFALIGTFAVVAFVVGRLYMLPAVGYVKASGAGQYNTLREGHSVIP